MSSDNPSLRPTRQREAILRLLDRERSFHTVRELHLRLYERGERIGLATIYRTLQRLASTGDVDVVYGPGPEAMYRRCSGDRHHHLVCRMCRLAIEITTSPIDSWTAAMSEEHGFVDISQAVELVGTCRTCHEPDGDPL